MGFEPYVPPNISVASFTLSVTWRGLFFTFLFSLVLFTSASCVEERVGIVGTGVPSD